MQPDNATALVLTDTASPTLLHRMTADTSFWIGFLLMAVPMLIAIAGPMLAPHDPNGFVGAPYAGSSGGALFGTDNLGRDVLSRFMAGGRMLIVLSSVATLLGVGGGSAAGGWLALERGRADAAVMRGADVLLAFPSIVLALTCLSLMGASAWLMALVVAAGHLPRTMRVIRAVALGVVERDFVKYAQTLGYSRARTVFGVVLPNLAVPIMVELGIRFTYSIGLVASLSFLGLGVQPPNPDWGNMINENRMAFSVQPWGVLLPLTAIASLAVGCNLLADCVGRAVNFIETRSKHG